MPAACSSGVPVSAWTSSMNTSCDSRCSWRAPPPSAGTSRIQLSVSTGSDSAAAIQPSMACRTWVSHVSCRSTAAAICRAISVFDWRSSAM